jgi:hypothetical protein
MSKDNKDTGTIDAFGELMDATQVKAVIKDRGWNSKEVAAYWGMTEGWLSKLVQNKNGERSVRDDCAFRGLPRK